MRLEVFNLLGQHIATLVDEERPAGFHTATWHATDRAGRAVGAGVYIYRMKVGVESQTGRMVLVDGQAGVSAAGVASVLSGVSGGGSDGVESEVYGLIVSGEGLAPYVDSSFQVEAGMVPVELVVSSGHPGGKAADDDCAFCDLFDALHDDEEGPGPSGKVQAALEAPPAPTNLRFDAPTDSSCTVRWDAAEGATDYDVNYKPAVGGRWTNEPHRGIRLYNTIHDLEPGTEYRWAVRAENGDGRSAWVFGPNFTTLEEETDETTQDVGADGQAPAAPTNLRFDAPTDSSCTVRWAAVEGATDYDVNYKPAVGGRWTNEPHRGTGLSNTINDLEPDTEYRWAVRAENGDGRSTWVFGPNFTTLEEKISEEEEEETPEEEEEETGEGDLVVYTSISKTSLTPGQALTLRARVQNQGTEEFQDLVLSYYRSNNATISTQDTQVGTDEVGSLAASSIRNKSIRLTVPSTPGIYYYGTCVERKSGESDTPSNCSTGVRVTIEEARTTASEFVLTCPTPDEVEDIDRDLELVFIDDPTAGWPLACAAEEGSVDLSVLQMGAYQTLRLMKAVDFAEPLPWTTLSLYDWFVTVVSTVDFDANAERSHAIPFEPKIVVTTKIETDVATGEIIQAPSWIYQYHHDKSRMGQAAVGLIQLFVHEARHVEGPGHTCDGVDDQTFAEMGAWAYAYYTLLWFSDKALPTDFFSSDDRAHFRVLIDIICSRFCQEGCP